jgi:hypothetical protein
MRRDWIWTLCLGIAVSWPSVGAEVKKTVIKLPLPALASDDSAGGIVAAELNGDGKPDFLVTRRGHLAVMRNDGATLWSKAIAIGVTSQSEANGLRAHAAQGFRPAYVSPPRTVI